MSETVSLSGGLLLFKKIPSNSVGYSVITFKATSKFKRSILTSQRSIKQWQKYLSQHLKNVSSELKDYPSDSYFQAMFDTTITFIVSVCVDYLVLLRVQV